MGLFTHKRMRQRMFKVSRAQSYATCDAGQPVVRLHSISCVFEMNQHGSDIQHSLLCGAPLCFLKETEGRNDPIAVVQTCTICACPVTLSSSGNIQTSVQFKLAGHGPVTYFPHNMLCNIRDEAVCHQLTNLHHSILSAKKSKNPNAAVLK